MKFERSFFTSPTREFSISTGGLRFAATTGYSLATLRVAWLNFKLEFSNEKCEMENQLRATHL